MRRCDLRFAEIGLLFSGVAAIAFGQQTRPTVRPPDPVVVAIDAAIQSLRTEQPIIFVQPNCSATGLNITAGPGGGTGLTINATGGGPGSQTTGMEISVNGGTCNVSSMAGEAVTKVVGPQVAQGIQLLTEIKSLIQAGTLDRDTLGQKVASLRSLRYLPPSIASMTDALARTKLR